jgi:pimeloyl-ACP methyl ester carboxylesterase
MGSAINIEEFFDYQGGAFTDVARQEIETSQALRIVDLSFPSPRAGRITSFLLLPQTEVRVPAIIFHHWGFGNRRSFLSEARAYARVGVASLLVDAPNMGARGRGLPRLDISDVAINYLKHAVVDVRRALDMLQQIPEIDASRTAYVGHSLGGAILGHLSAVETRFQAFVAMAAPGRISRIWAPRPNPAYLRTVAPFDGLNFIGLSQRPLLLQFGKRDGFVTLEDAQILARAAPKAAAVGWFDAGHSLNADARIARAEWLLKVLEHSKRPSPANLRDAPLPWQERLVAAIGERVFGFVRGPVAENIA